MQDGSAILGSQTQLSPYEEILRMANDGIVVSENNCILMVNPAFASIVMYSEDELVGMDFTMLLDPFTSHLYTEPRDRFSWSQRDRPSFRARLVNKERRVVPVEMSIADFVYDGRPATVNIIRDITKQVQLEEAAELSELRYRALFETSPLAHFTISRTGTIMETNDAASALLGHDRADIIRRKMSSFIPHDSGIGPDSEVLRAIMQGAVLREVEMRLQDSRGQPVWVGATSNPLVENGQVTAISLRVSDIGRRKTAEAKAQAEKERANLYLEILTHDLNNLNQSIVFSLGLLEETVNLSGLGKQLLDEANWTVKRSARTIGNLRLILTLNESPPEPRPTDIGFHIERAVVGVRDEFPARMIRFLNNVRVDEFSVVGNQYLEVALFNMIHNAVMFCDKHEAVVSIDAAKASNPKLLRITVEDNGPGIPDAMKELVFKRTGQPDKQKVGRGLSLTLVNSIVQGLGGTVWAEDRVQGRQEMGARLVVELPFWAEKRGLPCKRLACVQFYKSDHCAFCSQSMEALVEALNTLGISPGIIREVNVDDPTSGVTRNAIPMLPLITVCDLEFVGLVDYDTAISALTSLATKSCFDSG